MNSIKKIFEKIGVFVVLLGAILAIIISKRHLPTSEEIKEKKAEVKKQNETVDNKQEDVKTSGEGVKKASESAKEKSKDLKKDKEERDKKASKFFPDKKKGE